MTVDLGSSLGVLAVADPNWFFSTLSQSAAAIVGIIGGFFVARLLQQLPAVRESREDVIERFTAARDRVWSLRQGVLRYCEWANEIEPEVAKALAAGQSEITISMVRTIDGGSTTGPPQTYPISRGWLSQLALANELEPRFRDVGGRIARLTDIAMLPPLVSEYDALAISVPENLANAYDSLKIELRRVAHEATAHRTRAVPRQALQLIVLLGLIALLGIVVPLGFLTAGSGSRVEIKFVLLFVFALLLALLGIVLSRLIDEVRSAATLELPERLRWLA